MIKAEHLSKSFGGTRALHDLNLEIRAATVFGLVGTNGAGKSTFLRLAAGVLQAETGQISIDGAPVYENIAVKREIFYIPDEPYFFANATPAELAHYYRGLYTGFDMARFEELLAAFELAPVRKINTFSKGMKKQLAVLLALAANTRYLFRDETFDGLDPVMRQAVKSLLAEAVAARGLTPVIASHNLRELEDICDHIGLLHQGGLLLARDLEGLRLGVHKAQAIFETPRAQEDFGDLKIASLKRSGSLHTLIVEGEAAAVEQALAAYRPLFLELVPLTLEEVFIYETEVAGYDVKSLLFA